MVRPHYDGFKRVQALQLSLIVAPDGPGLETLEWPVCTSKA
jgi:hypothetical protein